jgi:hypothetical protein
MDNTVPMGEVSQSVYEKGEGQCTTPQRHLSHARIASSVVIVAVMYPVQLSGCGPGRVRHHKGTVDRGGEGRGKSEGWHTASVGLAVEEDLPVPIIKRPVLSFPMANALCLSMTACACGGDASSREIPSVFTIAQAQLEIVCHGRR